MVRVVDERRRDRTRPLRRQWSVAGIADLMVRSLEATEKAAPRWLQLLRETSDVPAAQVETAIFGMS